MSAFSPFSKRNDNTFGLRIALRSGGSILVLSRAFSWLRISGLLFNMRAKWFTPPYWQAISKAVSPYLFGTSNDAPSAIRNSATSGNPYRNASMSGVTLSLSWILISASHSSNLKTACLFFLTIAIMSGVPPWLVLAFTFAPCSQSKSMTSFILQVTATCSAVLPSLFSASMSQLLWTILSIICLCLWLNASCKRGTTVVWLTAIISFTFAPAFIKTSTITYCLHRTANVRAEIPSLSFVLGLTFISRSFRTDWTCPDAIAECNGVPFVGTLIVGSAPYLITSSIISTIPSLHAMWRADALSVSDACVKNSLDIVTSFFRILVVSRGFCKHSGDSRIPEHISRIVFTAKYFPFRTARWIGVSSCASFIRLLAPCFIKVWILLELPSAAERWRGVIPFLPWACTKAPCNNKISRTSGWSEYAAMCRGVNPASLQASVLALWLSSNFETSSWPKLAATWSGVSCLVVNISTLIPLWIIAIIASIFPYWAAWWIGK